MTWNSQAAVGAFVLGGTGLAVGAAVFFGQSHLFNPPTHAAVVFEGAITGLTVGAPVTFRGVHVGAVDTIGIVFDAKTHIAYIPVTIEIESGLIKVMDAAGSEAVTLPNGIKRGLRAELNTQSFVTGQSEIELDFDRDAAVKLHPEVTRLVEIPIRQSAIEKVKAQLSELPLRELVDNAAASMKSFHVLSDRLDLDLPPLVDSLKLTSDRSTLAVETATRAIADLQGRLDITLDSINQLAVNGDRQLTQRGGELHVLLGSTNQAVVQAHDVLADLKGLTSERTAARANIESALRDLATTAASLRGFASDVEHNPQLLLTGRRQ